MRLLYSLAAMVVAGLMSSVQAKEIEIDVFGGAIPNAPSDDIVIATDVGSGNYITNVVPAVTVQSLVQRQSTADARIQLQEEESITLQSMKVEEGAKNLSVGITAYEGSVGAASSQLTVDVADASSSLTVLANIILLGSHELVKAGLGRFVASGEFCGAITISGGMFSYADTLSTFNVAGACACDFSSSQTVRSQLNPKAPNPASPVASQETVVTGEGEIPIQEMQVNNGAVVRVDGANLIHPDLSDYPEDYCQTVPDCLLVGSNSVGVLKFDGGLFFGKMAIAMGGSGAAKGAVVAYNSAHIQNYCSTLGEWLLGCAGYGYLGVLDGSEYVAAGTWKAGRCNQFNLTVEDATFTQKVDAKREGGFHFGGKEGRSTLWVGRGAQFFCQGGSSDAHFPAVDEENVYSVQLAVTDQGRLDMGTNAIRTGGELRSGRACDAMFNIQSNGVVRAAGLKTEEDHLDGTSVNLQFDGGTWEITKSGEPFDYPLYAFAGGVTLGVDAGVTATLTARSPIVRPTGDGLATISLEGSELASATLIGPPAIMISGSGSGASAVCTYDAETRKVTGVRVTGRGCNYKSATARALYGSDSYDLDVTVSTNICGGLTKTGEGTLVLNGTNTYTGLTVVQGGMLTLDSPAVVASSCGLKLFNGGLLNLSQSEMSVDDFGGDGTGCVTNGQLSVRSLTCDFAKAKAGVHDTLNMTNVVFASNATLTIENISDAEVDKSQEYVLYEFVGEAPHRMPLTDETSYANLSPAWGVVVRENKAILRYLDGSLFIYY